MSTYDIIMLVVIIGAIAFGWWKGLAWQIASLAAIVISYFVSLNFREPLSRYISAEEPWNRIAAMLILFLGTSLVIWTIYASVSKSLKKMELKGFDRQAGAVLGAVKGAILCMVITMFSVSLLGEKAHDAIHNSRSGRYVVKGITKISAIVPAELAKYVQPHVENFHNAIGHDGNLPIDQYPENPPFNFSSGGQVAQDPNLVPQYQGQWQTTQPNTGYGGQPNQNGGSGQQQFNPGWNTGTANQNNSGSTQQTGYQYGQNVGGSNSTITQGANGWPDMNFQVNSKDVLDAAKAAAAEAARRAFENQNQNR